MRRALFIVLLIFMSASTVAAARQIDGRCMYATWPGGTQSVSSMIANHPTTYNCIDIDCLATDSAGYNVTNASYADGTTGGVILRGNDSFIINDSQDLRNLQAHCDLPAFTTALCSSRGEWTLNVRVSRYFDLDPTADQPSTAGNMTSMFGGPVKPTNGLSLETFYRGIANAYNCQDRVPPQLSARQQPDLTSGTTRIDLHYSDDEYNYRSSFDAKAVHLLANNSNAQLPTIDGTTLASCGYEIRTDTSTPSLPTATYSNAATSSPSVGSWVTYDCANRYYDAENFTIPANTLTNGGTLWMYAYDSAGNHARTKIAIPKRYTSNGGQGYCPRAGECLLDPNGDASMNTFASYIAGKTNQQPAPSPACIAQGQGADNAYCDQNGLVSRSEALLAFGAQQLQGQNGIVACGNPGSILGQGYAKADSCGTKTSCSLSCIVTKDANNGATQPSAVLFAANNYLQSPLGPDEVHLPPYISTTIVSDLDQTTGERYTNVSACSTGSKADCSVSLTKSSPLGNQVEVRYDNASGIGSLGQTLTVQPFSTTREHAGQIVLEQAGIVSLAHAMTTYAGDIAATSSGSYVPRYTAATIGRSVHASAYRKAPGGTILGVVTKVPNFESYSSGTGSLATTQDLYEIGVIYNGTFDLSYIDTAKDAIKDLPTAALRDVATPINGTTGSGTLIITAATNDEQNAQRIIDQLVTRLRPVGP